MSNQQSTIINQQSTFSIVTPSYNQLDWLRLCTASVRDQVASKSTILPLAVEHIIQDAGSPGIEEFAREVGADFYRDGALVFRSAHPIPNHSLTIYAERDEGMYDAVNRGFAKAKGDVIAYLNCDEQYLPEALGSVALRFETEKDLEMLFADAVVVDGDGGFICFRKAQVPFRDQLWFRMPILSCATFVRRSSFSEKKVTLDETKKVLGDVIWIMRAQRAKLKMGVLRQFTSAFAETDQNLGVGGAADAEFLELRLQMPEHVRRFLPVYEFFHKVRSLFSGTRSHPAFSYEIFCRGQENSRRRFAVSHPTAVWRGRVGIDKEVVKATLHVK